MSSMTRTEQEARPSPSLDRARVVKGGQGFRAAQGPDYQPGISTESVGAEDLWLGRITLAPGARTRAHVHAHHETALYMLSGGAVEIWTGEELQFKARVRAGDYLFIPKNVAHVAVNRGEEPAVFIGARTDPSAEESVIMRAELDARVP